MHLADRDGPRTERKVEGREKGLRERMRRKKERKKRRHMQKYSREEGGVNRKKTAKSPQGFHDDGLCSQAGLYISWNHFKKWSF